MIDFSITEKENMEKLKYIFEANSSENQTLKPKVTLTSFSNSWSL